MVTSRAVIARGIQYLFLIWNIFLAWIPLVFSLIIYRLSKKDKKNSLYIAVLGFIWLIFYPNAPYIVTDIIHLSIYDYYKSVVNGLSYNSDLKVWYDFLMIMLFVFTGYILGFVSLNINHRMIEGKFGKALGWGFTVIVSLLSGFAIYLGRFLRLNSWEIVSNTYGLILDILNTIHLQSLIFTFMFGSFIFMTYILFYNLIRK